MIRMPEWIYKAPKIFYILASLVFLFNFYVAYQVFVETRDARGFVDEATYLAFFQSLFYGFTDAIYITANGILFKILLVFWAKYEGLKVTEAAE